MAFDLSTWKAKVAERMQDWRPRMQRAGVNSVYAFLSAAALWPVVEAYQRGDVVAVFALGGVLASVGTNLLANRIQTWKDEADAARQLAADVPGDAALRGELDEVLDRLEAVSQARSGLAPTDQEWFVKTLGAELARLGNLTRFEATLRGVAIGGDLQGVVVTGDNNSVNYIVHQYSTQEGQPPSQAAFQQQIGNYLAWMRDRCGTLELRGIKREGQQVVQLDLETVYVPLEAEVYDPLDKVVTRPEMREPLAPRSIGLEQVLGLGRRIIVTGGPGSGKTTVLLHIAWTLATAIATDDPALAREKLGLDMESPLPIFVPLSAYAVYLRQLPAASASHERTLAAFISRYLIEKQTSFDLPDDFFQALMRDGRAVILLLDGLDEVPDEAQRVRVRQAIEELVTGRERMRVVVTCRTAAYKDRTALGKGFREVRVEPLDDEHIEALVQAAYAHIYRLDPIARQNKTEELLQGIHNLEAERRRRLGEETERLVSSPLLVRMLLVVHFSERRLPEQRAELYMKATDAMLLPEYAPDEEIADRIGRLVGGSREIHRDLVQHLAFTMHSRGETQGREIGEDDLRRVLGGHSSYAMLVDDFIALTRLRGTLLEERLGVYRFIHLAFQEYLAARYLAEIVRGEAGVEGIAVFLEAGPILESWWREPALLVTGYLSVISPQTAQTFLRRLAGLDHGAAQRNQELSPDLQLAAAEVATMAFVEWQTPGTDLERTLTGRLVDIFQDTRLMYQAHPRQRAAAGDALARLRDPRPGVGVHLLPSPSPGEGPGVRVLPSPPQGEGPGVRVLPSPSPGEGPGVRVLPDIAWRPVPAGPFWMGEGKDQHLNECLDYDYYISRYPVTVAQFATFVEAGGYREARYWPEADKAGVWQSGRVKGWLDDKSRAQPYDFGEPFNLPNHPVVGVTWYEALAFCRWLTEQIRKLASQQIDKLTNQQMSKSANRQVGEERKQQEDNLLSSILRSADLRFADLSFADLPFADFVVSLPSEAEWEKAARGGATPDNPYPQRRYPWDDHQADPNWANYDKTGIGATSPVGCFPGGASPYGVEELSGNVWEWTRSHYRAYPYRPEDGREALGAGPDIPRVLRGGAFYYDVDVVRCAARLSLNPLDRYRDVGFRLVVVSPL